MSEAGISVPVLCFLLLDRDADPLWLALHLISGLVHTVNMDHFKNAVFVMAKLSHPQ